MFFPYVHLLCLLHSFTFSFSFSFFFPSPPAVNALWSSWEPWSGWSTTCGDGSATRSRTCGYPVGLDTRCRGVSTCSGSGSDSKSRTAYLAVNGAWVRGQWQLGLFVSLNRDDACFQFCACFCFVLLCFALFCFVLFCFVMFCACFACLVLLLSLLLIFLLLVLLFSFFVLPFYSHSCSLISYFLFLAEHVDTERRNVCHADWIDHAHAVVQRGVVWRRDVQRGHHAVGDHRYGRHLLR